MSTRTSDRYPETLAKRSVSSNASRVALVWRRCATVARRGRITSTGGWLSGFHGLTSDGDGVAAKCQSATMPAAPTPMMPAKTLMPVRLMKFMVLPLNSALAARLFRRPIIVVGGSAATIRHRGGPRLRLEIAAMGVVRIERSGNRGAPRLERGQDRRQDDERGARCPEETADHRPPKRGTLLSAFAYAQRHWHHTGQHRETCHQDRTQTASCAFYCSLPWFAALDPAALRESHKQDGVCHGHADRHDRTHEGLNVERGPGEPQHKHDPGNDGGNRRPYRQGKPERLEVS